jgi:DNA-directed RNA polymerase subunit beta
MDQKTFSDYQQPIIDYPNLVRDQLESFQEVVDEGIWDLFQEFSPITDHNEEKFSFEFVDIEIGEPQVTPEYARHHEMTYDAPLRATIRLKNKSIGSEEEQEIFMSDFPLMTDNGSFIINGVERVITPQLIRSFGVLFVTNEKRDGEYFGAKIVPARGAWVEIESDHNDMINVRLDRKRKFPITTLLRVLGAETDEEIRELFADDEHVQEYLDATLESDMATNEEDAYVAVYKKLREGDIVSFSNAKDYVDSLFTEERYDLSEVGRYRFNDRFDKGTSEEDLQKQVIDLDDIVTIIRHIAELNNDPEAEADDIDHLGTRRVRFIGETLRKKLRVAMTQMRRNVRDKMSTVDIDTTLPVKLLSPRPLQARLKEFYATNQLSQFMHQDNILDELEHIRTFTAKGPGGLTQERAGFDVRDVHTSHYGRVCPIHTPEGANIGLILHPANYSRVNQFGVLEAPYAKVEGGTVTDHVDYLNAYEEEKQNIAHAATKRDDDGNIIEDKVEVRHQGDPKEVSSDEVDYIDVAPDQAFSVATSMIPFLDHNDASRALMGANMQKQATPCVDPEKPLVATGIEETAAKNTGRVVLAQADGEVTEVDANHIVVERDESGRGEPEEDEYTLATYERTNARTSFHQRPVVDVGESVSAGDVLADTSSSEDGQMALGKNVKIAFMSWYGANYEDAIIISERLVKRDTFTSVHIEEFDVNVRETKLGPEVTTHDIPNVSEEKLKNLDEDGIIRVGAEVEPGDILVGKITPKGETQLTPEERLLRSIFGDKARDVKDSSKRMEKGKRGRVVNVKVFDREDGDDLDSGILKRVVVEVAQLRRLRVGDKLAGRHGNKGVISKVLPEEEMPYDDDGEPVDVLLTPLGVPSRMNLGQILEMHLGLAANELDYQAVVPPFMGATEEEIKEELEEAGYPENGKVTLYDGRTGEPFEQDIAIGYKYILKLHHMIEDKVHSRSTGPYSLKTQQPLGGRAQNGGQRFGEMEVWALLGYGAAHNLQEVLTIKSDDILGRSSAFDAMVQGEPIEHMNAPASFNVLLNNLRAMALDVEVKLESEVEETA